MGLSQALDIASSGLRATQNGLSLIASNVANAGTAGYVRKVAGLQERPGADVGIGVNTTGVLRELDTYVQSQLRTESSGGAYANLRAQFYKQLQGIYGTPGSDSALETLYNNFTSALQALTTNPSDYSARAGVLGTAQSLAQQLNQTTNQIQALRANAEQGISTAIQSANDALQGIAQINQRLGSTNTSDAATAALQDQRDQYVDQLAKLMDIRVIDNSNGSISVFTGSGLQLVGDKAGRLIFNPQGTITASSQWSADPAKNSVGTIMLQIDSSSGNVGTDLIANNAIRSGQLAGYIEMRDKILTQAQTQIDGLAAAMSSALSDRTATASPVTSGAQSGFEVDVGSLLAGNKITLNYTDTSTSVQRTRTIVRVDDPTILPLPPSTNPNNRIVGIDWSNGLGSVVNQLNALFGGRIQFSNPPSTTNLQILDDGIANTTDINSVSAVSTIASLTAGAAQLPFFTDGTQPYTGAISKSGSQFTGFAGRIAVNPLLVADPTKLVDMTGSTPSGDTVRANFIYSQMATASQTYPPSTGFGSLASPFASSLPTYLQQFMSQQGDAAQNAKSLSDGQDLVVAALQQKFDETSGINVDQEMANLVTLQTAYSANARVLSTVKDMIDILLRIGQ
jgi:flagellar hook-associated protein 1 FlgK